MAKIKPKVDLAGLQLLGFQEPKIDDLPTEKLKASEAHISGQIKIEREPVAIIRQLYLMFI
jgi:hypothetical protein